MISRRPSSVKTSSLGLQAMRLHLLGDQVALGDLDLLVLGIAFEADDLHPVEQRLRHVERVGGGHEHHVRQIVVELQIMVLEAAVLLGIEDLEQRRGRIAAEILAELVDLVEQEQRVGRPRFLDVGDDLARQRADIGRRWPRISASSRTPPSDWRTNSRPVARAIERPSEVLPTPGGPTRHRIGPLSCWCGPGPRDTRRSGP